MATRIITSTRKYDDLTNKPGARTYEFTIDGETYLIDLADDGNALRAALAPFIAAGRRAPGDLVAMDLAPMDTLSVKAWARDNDVHLPRGRVTKRVRAQYEAAHPQR